MADAKVSLDKLNDANYEVWKFKMELLLMKEDLLDIVIKTKPESVTPEWSAKDGKARAMIGLAVEDSQLVHIIRKQSAKEMWDTLKQIHEASSLSTTLHVLRQLCSLRLSEEGNLLVHLNEMTALQNRLEVMNEGLTDRVFIALILSSLPPSYGSLINVIENKPEEDLTVDFVKSKLRSEFRRRQECEGSVVNDKALKIVSEKFKPNEKSKQGVCHYCQQPGHFRRDCKKFARDKAEKMKKNNSKVNLAVEKPSNMNMCLATGALCDKNQWYLDSGATSHMTSDVKLLKNVDRSKKTEICLADGTAIECSGSGDSSLVTVSGSGARMDVTLSDVYYVPSLMGNLLSVGKVCDSGYSVLFEKSGCKVLHNRKTVLTGERSNGLYRLKEFYESAFVSTNKHPELCEHLWHRRLGHRDPEAILKIVREELGFGLKMQKCSVHYVCGTCMEGKMSRLPFPKQSLSKSCEIGDLIHTDVGGPMEEVTPSGNKYYVTMIDDFSSYTAVYVLKSKSEVESRIREYCEMMKNQFGRYPRVLRSDGGGEYSSVSLKKYLVSNGIILQQTAPYSPQQNGKAERKNRYLMEMVRCLLSESGMSKMYWGEALCTACYLQNRLPTSVVNKTPYELWNGKKPSYTHLRIFGSQAYVHVPKEKRRKLDAKAVKLIFVGYEQARKAYRFLNPEDNSIVISRDAKFVELDSIEKFVCKNQNSLEQNSIVENDDGGADEMIEQKFSVSLGSNSRETEIVDPEGNEDDVGSVMNDTMYDNASEGESSFHGFPLDEIARRSARPTKGVPPQRLIEEIFTVVSVPPKEEKEPRNVQEALRGNRGVEWKQAMLDELKSHATNGTWELVELPTGRKPIGCRWVYKIKRDASGKPAKYKARLVAQGYNQKYGQDFDEVYAPVIQQTTLRTLLAVASKRNLLLKHYDIKTAYLYANLEEELYMRQPAGFEENGKEQLVCRLRRSIYGLKQSARCWNQRIHTVLQNLNFEQSQSDPCLYIKFTNGKQLYLLIYVDDILMACESDMEIENVYRALKDEFEITDLGEAKYFLGLEISKINGKYGISLEGYISRLIENFGLGEAKGAKTPMDEGFAKTGTDSPLLDNDIPYRSIVGALLYVAVSARPDIAVSASILGRSVSAPTVADWTAAKRVVRYLKTTKHLQLRYDDPNGKLIGYSDADWAGDLKTRRSTAGSVFLFAGGAIAWTSRLQNCVTLSSMESEYVALSEASQEAVWLARLFKDFGEHLDNPITIMEDNQSCIGFIASKRSTRRSKHIETREYYVKELCDNNQLQLKYCPSEDMVADILTKPLGAIKQNKFSTMLGLHDIIKDR